jgi:hypothetical protein
MTSQLGRSETDYKRAQAELAELEASYKEFAANAGLAAAGWAPPPWGTAADLVSLGKSLFKADWGGALFDAIGVIPIAGDAAKAGKLGKRLQALEAALDAAKIKLARHAANLITARKAAAKKYWRKIVSEGRKRFDEAIKGCVTQACKNEKVGLIGEHYKQTPVDGPGKGEWKNGLRGDGDFVPHPESKLGQELKRFSDSALNTSGKKLDRIPYRDGFPDYTDFVVPAGAGKKAEVEIFQAGNKDDFSAADEALRKATGKTRADLEMELGTKLTWHHKEDGVTMQLVPTKLHGASSGSGHSGGTSLNKQEEF